MLISYQSSYVSTILSYYKMRINMNNFYPNDPLSTNINTTISGYIPFSNIGSYLFTINYTSSINISLLMPPSTEGSANFISIQSYIENSGDIDSCLVGIDTVLPNTFNIGVNSTSF
jgi:hypothetical protein